MRVDLFSQKMSDCEWSEGNSGRGHCSRTLKDMIKEINFSAVLQPLGTVALYTARLDFSHSNSGVENLGNEVRELRRGIVSATAAVNLRPK